MEETVDRLEKRASLILNCINIINLVNVWGTRESEQQKKTKMGQSLKTQRFNQV